MSRHNLSAIDGSRRHGPRPAIARVTFAARQGRPRVTRLIPLAGLAALAVLAPAPRAASAQSTSGPAANPTASAQLAGATAANGVLPRVFFACYVPSSGAVYRIREPGLPDTCSATGKHDHIEFSWTDGLEGNEHGALAGLGADDHPQYLLADGTRSLTGTLNAGAFRITNLAAGTSSSDAIRYDQAVKQSESAGGDLAGAYPDPTVAGLRGIAVAATAPQAGQVLAYDGTAWAPANPSAGATDHGALTGLENDDHTQYLLTDGVREATDGFAVTGQPGTGAIPATGSGARLMWYPNRAAFRAGVVDGSQWDADKIGLGSVALGQNTTASGAAATAFGTWSLATGNHAVAMGNFTQASGFGSTAIGNATVASGHNATAMGISTTAGGTAAVAAGMLTNATGVASTALGWESAATGNNATAMGRFTSASSYASLVIGRYNVFGGSATEWIATDPLLVAGNGSSGADRSNALTLLKNGDLNIAGTLTQASDIRLKEDIIPLEGALERVLRLTPIRYRFRAGGGHPEQPRLGLSAQEVQDLFPELVHQGADGYLAVAYPELAAVLVAAIKEQQRRIDALEARLVP
jgi:hypothetical protein